MSSKAEMPPNESARLDALRRYQILDSPPDGAFDHLTAVAVALFHVPIAIVSLVDHDRIWFKSHAGIDACQTDREPGFCASAILSSDLYEVRDARIDPRTLTNPLVVCELGLRFYAAAPLRTRDGFNLGTLCIIDREPRQLSKSEGELLKKLAAMVIDQMELRLAARKISIAEQEQQKLSEQVRHANQLLQVSEQRFRDLYDEAPIAYVHEGIDSRFISANRAAMRILGIQPEDIEGTYGHSFIPDVPDARRRFDEAFAKVSEGADTSGLTLELRRKDNGEPIWIQWWSKPDPSGTSTRTMFIDITDRVLMEQEQARLKAQNEYLCEEILSNHNFGAVVGESPGLRKVMQQTQLVAATEASVLINGESGTGKELIARAIHDQSSRKDRVLIKVNCSAVPDSLFESEFFGHVRGAFTGAVKDKPGRFELAEGGTLFLDEIGEVPLAMQAKLLRVLQEQEIERVGDIRVRKVNVRIIAATNRDLKSEVEAGRFRQDLFYRLSVFPIELPPLRQRRDDIPLLASHFAKLIALKMNRGTPSITRAVMSQLTAYDWPGNVRELQNAVERAVILSEGTPLQFDIGGPRTPTSHDPTKGRIMEQSLVTQDVLKKQERDNILSALRHSHGKIFGPGGAAELLGMKPTTLASRLRVMGITARSSR